MMGFLDEIWKTILFKLLREFSGESYLPASVHKNYV